MNLTNEMPEIKMPKKASINWDKVENETPHAFWSIVSWLTVDFNLRSGTGYSDLVFTEGKDLVLERRNIVNGKKQHRLINFRELYECFEDHGYYVEILIEGGQYFGNVITTDGLPDHKITWATKKYRLRQDAEITAIGYCVYSMNVEGIKENDRKEQKEKEHSKQKLGSLIQAVADSKS